MKRKKVLIVEDEERMRILIGDYLKSEGFEVIEAADGAEGIEKFSAQKPDIVVLDIMLPEIDGWTVCRKIREESDAPIVMLTARSEESDELFGFELGADEYITKPFSPKILVARIKALMSRAIEDENQVMEVGCISIDAAGHTASIEGKRVDLTPKEYELLLYMLKNREIALSREQILDAVWGFDYYGDYRTVDTHIKRLRTKLENCGDYIQTVRGLGYKFGVKS
ncbi:putative transcriptional regulatory protein YclJ [Peptoclostridium acidaminophilum DSM 3953]|uniref:Stage 0 sporulation protein A homolog n=1 Tax=Peptoclostridium acidaminophilum DSM 3953 TaxID=1286171 RepID=W8T905_PEPAC|nr:response regulator transcription factor [Peptoclostridium acidaminophilum]AHM57390.1 putative transcriptional regulatory protein YclJ [Peptoclostridium acidaminophilum DSM 3953]